MNGADTVIPFSGGLDPLPFSWSVQGLGSASAGDSSITIPKSVYKNYKYFYVTNDASITCVIINGGWYNINQNGMNTISNFAFDTYGFVFFMRQNGTGTGHTNVWFTNDPNFRP